MIGTAVENPLRAARDEERPCWLAALVNTLPLVFLSLAIMVEGFPRPPFPAVMGIGWFFLSIASAGWLIWKRWLKADLLIYSVLPMTLVFLLDEITTTYKTPFIFACMLILAAGAVIAQQARVIWLRLAVLLAGGALMLWAANHAMGNFWQLHENLNIERCFIDARGCPPLPVDAPDWWQLFFW